MNALATAETAPSIDAVIGRNVDFLIWRSRERKAQTAAALGMSPQSLSQKLNGQRPWSAAEIQRAARRFHVSIDDLFRELPGLDSNQEPIGYTPADELRRHRAEKEAAHKAVARPRNGEAPAA